MDSVQFVSTIFGYRFQNPGEFTLQQTVWFLGCGYSSERTITVLEPLEARIRPEGVVCEPPPLNLTVSSKPSADRLYMEHGAEKSRTERFTSPVSIRSR
ncbi:MAG: hypothetical protein IPJ00_06240 [Saprospirales bacterium]|nr:hypothetical protein [Saprospirales bacterium]